MEGEKMETPETNQNKGIGNIYHNIKDIAANKLKIKDSTTKMSILKKDDIKMPNYKYRLNNYKDNYNCSVIYDKGAYMALGGFWNGNIIIKSLDYKSIAKGKEINKLSFIYTTYEFSPITKIVIDETETFAICANKLGTVFVFVINPEKKYVWLLSKILPYQKSEITALSISSNLNMFISCSKNGNCMLYSLPRVKMFNSWNIEVQNDENENNNLDNILCTIILIFHTPLPCFIFYIKNLNYLYVYSINGKFLKKHKLKYEIVNNGICKYIDYQFKDYLMIYNSIDKTIDIFRGIDFEFVAKSPIINYKFIDFVLSKSLDQVLILVENNLNDKSNDADNKKSNIKYKVLVLKDKENQLMWK
jgi:WD40 repeat protein